MILKIISKMIGKTMIWTMVGFIRLYQIALSPVLGQRCRFYPSCSHYAITALRAHGFYGLLLAIYRVLRCQPFCNGGFDPVPADKVLKKVSTDDGF